MRKMKKLLSVLLFCLAIMSMTVTANAAIKVNGGKTAVVTVGKTTALKVTGTTKTVKWSSENKNIASVSPKGVVKGIKTGTTTIKAKIGTKVYKCQVSVKPNVYKCDLSNHVWNGTEPSFPVSQMYYRNGKLVCEGVWGNPTNIDYTKLVYDIKVCNGKKVIAKERFVWNGGIFKSRTTMKDTLVFDTGAFVKNLDLREIKNLHTYITILY